MRTNMLVPELLQAHMENTEKNIASGYIHILHTKLMVK